MSLVAKKPRRPVGQDEEDRVFTRKMKYWASAAKETSFVNRGEEGGIPEIAIIGRSNVGKSSLINALTEQQYVIFSSLLASKQLFT